MATSPGLLEPDAGDRALGSADALSHSRLGHQVGLRNLAGGQPADSAQRECDGGRRRQRRVRAQKVELECVVHARHRPADRPLAWLLVRPKLPLATSRIRTDPVEEPPPGHRDQPALRVPRRVVRPDPDRLEQSVLHGVLGRREICSAADEDAEHARSQTPKQGVVHDRFQSVMVGGSVRKGRSSSHS